MHVEGDHEAMDRAGEEEVCQLWCLNSILGPLGSHQRNLSRGISGLGYCVSVDPSGDGGFFTQGHKGLLSPHRNQSIGNRKSY